MFALLVGMWVAACGSSAPVTTDEAPVTTEGPEDGFVRLTFSLSPTDAVSQVYEDDLTHFEVSRVGDETVIYGFLDENGAIDVPGPLLGETLRVEAEYPDDPFCWWTGSTAINQTASTLDLTVELDEVCA